MYNQWATDPGLSLNYPRPKSTTHLRTFSDNGVYVAKYSIGATGDTLSNVESQIFTPYNFGSSARIEPLTTRPLSHGSLLIVEHVWISYYIIELEP